MSYQANYDQLVYEAQATRQSFNINAWLLEPNIVFQEISFALGKLPKASHNGSLQVATFNGEFLDLAKASYFQESYLEIIKCFHLLFLEEVSQAAITFLAELSGYTGFCSQENSRGQAVGFLVHPRLTVVGNPLEYSQVAEIAGIPDLRPAYRLDLQDIVSTSGTELSKDKANKPKIFSATVHHGKSMRGGIRLTASVRYKQLDILQELLGADYIGLVGGDFNCFLDNADLYESAPLRNNGYKLVHPGSNTATHSFGARLDGFWAKNLIHQVNSYRVHSFWRHKNIGCYFSDHSLVSMQLSTHQNHDIS